jgi:signal transduction histidine kinase
MSLVNWKRWRKQPFRFAINTEGIPLFEPILHPSRGRIRALGLSCALGHPLFYAIWTHWVPQPYERLWQRLGTSFLGILLLAIPSLQAQPPSRMAILILSLLFWLTLPVFFTWMYLCNGRNSVWFATMASMFLIYYHLTDWRIATLGIASGIPAGWALFAAAGPALPASSLEDTLSHTVVFAFAWYMGLTLGISSSNLRRAQLKQALATMGIMAHELRTPLSTMTLMGNALREQASQALPGSTDAVDQLIARLLATVHHMNRQIDMQISNARLMQLPLPTGCVSAGDLVQQAVQGFPFRNAIERDCVQVHVRRDFAFRGSEVLFTQVIDNLLKNALRALAAMPNTPQAGDLQLEVDVTPAGPQPGRIAVTDRGHGIDVEMQTRLFQPFVSTHQGTGHGLGLAFCHRVVHASGGIIRVESAPGCGARFILQLPVHA